MLIEIVAESLAAVATILLCVAGYAFIRRGPPAGTDWPGDSSEAVEPRFRVACRECGDEWTARKPPRCPTLCAICVLRTIDPSTDRPTGRRQGGGKAS